MSATIESMEKVQKAAVEFADGLQAQLVQILGRQPDLSEFVTFYTGVAGTTAGHALATIFGVAGKDQAASWIGEFLGAVQLMARRSGADVVLQGGVELSVVPSMVPAPQAQPEKKDDDVCRCEPRPGDCEPCKGKIVARIDGYADVIHKVASLARPDSFCGPCTRKMVDRLIAQNLKKSASTFGSDLPAALEVFMAIIFPQIRTAGKGVVWTETEKALSELVQVVQASRKA